MRFAGMDWSLGVLVASLGIDQDWVTAEAVVRQRRQRNIYSKAILNSETALIGGWGNSEHMVEYRPSGRVRVVRMGLRTRAMVVADEVCGRRQRLGRLRVRNLEVANGGKGVER